MDGPIVTVGLCVKNCEETIASTLDSLITQDYSHGLIEIIVVDDGCRDNTISIIVKKLLKTDLDFKILKTGGKGLGLARQMVVNNARGKYIVWIDGDITIPTDFIRKQVAYMESHQNVGRARANWRFEKQPDNFMMNYHLFAYAYQVKERAQPKISGIGGSICRVSAIKDAGGFDINIKGAGEDVDLALRMSMRGWKFAVTDTYFNHKAKNSWKALWKQNMWYGYGAHYTCHKFKMKSIKISNFPLIALLISIRKAQIAYQSTRIKSAFLLPLPYFLNSVAWWIGYIKAHFEKYCPNSTQTL
jgi:glycosyltransferase involved in cell wall biosynthesis